MRTHEVVVNIAGVPTEVQFSVGQNALENHELVSASAPSDLWVHVTGRPSCHVVAHLPPTMPTASKERRKALRLVGKQGAVLCKRYSKYVNEKNVCMDVTPISNVSIPEDAPAGTVVLVNPDIVTGVKV